MIGLLGNIKLIIGTVLLVVVSYFVYDYVDTKQNYNELQVNYDKTVDAYEQSILILEKVSREKAIVETKAKAVNNSVKRLNKLKEAKREVVDDDNYELVNF